MDTMGILVLVAFVQLFVFGYLGLWVAGQCGRKQIEGFVLGALFGPLGVVIEALLPRYDGE